MQTSVLKQDTIALLSLKNSTRKKLYFSERSNKLCDAVTRWKLKRDGVKRRTQVVGNCAVLFGLRKTKHANLHIRSGICEELSLIARILKVEKQFQYDRKS